MQYFLIRRATLGDRLLSFAVEAVIYQCLASRGAFHSQTLGWKSLRHSAHSMYTMYTIMPSSEQRHQPKVKQ